MFYSTKTYNHSIGLSCAFRQWRANSHCKYIHGYAISVKLMFRSSHLDYQNFVMDFGGLKPIKQWLENTFDHKTLIAMDDPEFAKFLELDKIGLIQMCPVQDTGCESFAKMIYEYVNLWLATEHAHCRLYSVEVREHEGNSAIYESDDGIEST